MKKVNGGYIVKQFVITVIAALIIGVAAWLALSVRWMMLYRNLWL